MSEEFVIVPKSDIIEMADNIRNKTNSTDLLSWAEITDNFYTLQTEHCNLTLDSNLANLVSTTEGSLIILLIYEDLAGRYSSINLSHYAGQTIEVLKGLPIVLAKETSGSHPLEVLFTYDQDISHEGDYIYINKSQGWTPFQLSTMIGQTEYPLYNGSLIVSYEAFQGFIITEDCTLKLISGGDGTAAPD